MKKILIFLLPCLCYAKPIIGKITYNGTENSKIIWINSNLKTNSSLNISDVDMLVDNFKFAKNNNVNVNIEPSKENGKVNVVITNIKTNPFSFSFGIDNYGKKFDDGIYRYTVDLSSSGLILNENLNISYTFVKPINPERKKKVELKPGEIVEVPKPEELKKARKNNNLTVELSFPFKNTKTYLTYSYKEYKKSILGNNDIYDVSGNSHRAGIKLNTLVKRDKVSKLSVVTAYDYTNRKSYIEDVLLSNDKIHEIHLGYEYEYKNIYLENIYNYNISENIPSFDTKLVINKGQVISANINNHLEKNNNSLETSIDFEHKGIYSKIGLVTDFKEVNPDLKLGIRKKIWKFNVDTSLNYSKSFRCLFNIKFSI